MNEGSFDIGILKDFWAEAYIPARLREPAAITEPNVKIHLFGHSLGVTIVHDFLFGLFKKGHEVGLVARHFAQFMKAITGTVEGDLSVSEHLILQGMVTGNITVEQGGSLHLHGMCCKSLIVNLGGTATVHGMVSEDITNRGGNVSVFGMVVGSVHSQSGETHIAPSAVVQNKRSSVANDDGS